MPDLREQLSRCLEGRVCLMGLGNVDYGDDGFGVRMMERLQAKLANGDGSDVRAIIAGNTPECLLGRCVDECYDYLIFIDAVDFGGEPGDVVFLDSKEMATRFPQISTHKISLSLLAKCAEANGRTKVWLLGVQPQSLFATPHLTAKVQQTFEVLSELFDELLSPANVC